MELLYPFFCFLLNNNALFYFEFFKKYIHFLFALFLFLFVLSGEENRERNKSNSSQGE